jgi:hypothetical protein
MKKNPEIKRLDDDYYEVHGHKYAYHLVTLSTVALEALDVIISLCNIMAQAEETQLNPLDVTATLTGLVLHARKRIEKAALMMEEGCGVITLHQRTEYMPWLEDEYLGVEFVPNGSDRMGVIHVYNDHIRERHETLM